MPVLVINVILPPQYYDINLSTDKKQILLFKEDVLFVAFQEVFRSAVDASNTHMQVASVVTPIPSFFERQESGRRRGEGMESAGSVKSTKSMESMESVKSMESMDSTKSTKSTKSMESTQSTVSVEPVTPVKPVKPTTPQTPNPPSQSRKRPSPSSLETTLSSQPEIRVTPSPLSEERDNSSILTLISSDDDSFNTNISSSSILNQWNTIRSHISSPTKPKSLLHPHFAESQSDCSDPSQSVVETELTLELSKVTDRWTSDV